MRIILPKEEIRSERITVSGEKARYLISVLRCSPGDDLQIFDGEGNIYKSRISSIDNKKVVVEIFEKSCCDSESPLNLILIQSILKGEKMDFVIQKATELGVQKIIPAVTERSQVRQTRKVSRWRKIAEEASKQSGRPSVPVIHEYVSFTDIFSSNKLTGIIFYEGGGISLSEAIQNIKMQDLSAEADTGYTIQNKNNLASLPFYICIGPEGGFTKQEVKLAADKGLIAVFLGRRVLRAETAALSAVTLVQFLIGDFH
jgi:16S rRNA (uracil1498-N3)-methyltransferase